METVLIITILGVLCIIFYMINRKKTGRKESGNVGGQGEIEKPTNQNELINIP